MIPGGGDKEFYDSIPKGKNNVKEEVIPDTSGEGGGRRQAILEKRRDGGKETGKVDETCLLYTSDAADEP